MADNIRKNVKLVDIMGDYPLDDFLVKCRLDFSFFLERVLGYDLGKHHKEWIELINDPENRNLGIMCARGHGKSFFFSIAFPMWKALFNGGLNFLIVSASQDQASKILENIGKTIENNEFLSCLMPLNHRESW